jgi:uncharacterized membrane protein YgcG
VLVAGGEAFSFDQRTRIEKARVAAEEQTGITFSVRVGPVDGDVPSAAESMLANIVGSTHDPAVLILVAPGERVVEVTTTAAARRRISDHAAGLAVLTMTSSFGVGDLVGGLVNGLRQLADAAGAAVHAPAVPAAH